MNKKVLVVLHCLYLCTSAEDLTVQGCGKSIVPKIHDKAIIGGKFAANGSYPWMASLQQDSTVIHMCGATVINEHWVVTAAHCFKNLYLPALDVVVGLHNLSESYHPTVHYVKVSKTVMHEDFDNQTAVNDIALLKTSRPIDIKGSKGYVNGICLPHTNEDPTGNAKVIGWGVTSIDSKNVSDVLREVEVPIVDRKSCSEAYEKKFGRKLEETKICAGTESKGSCIYDSGGSLFQTDNEGVSTLIGIVSYGIHEGDKLHPGVYTKVSAYLPWLKKVMESN